jgi:asparagine synthase (glutamine-hydrolysing)
MCILSSLKQLNKLKNINTYTAIYDDKNVSEEKLIIKLSKKWGFKTNFIKIDAKSVVKNFDDYIKCYDDLEFMPNSFAMYYLCKKIKNKKVLLTGIGGDEIFLGYKTHIASNIKSYFKEKSHICNFLYKIKFLELYNENIERFLYGCSKSYLESFFLWRNIHKISEINTNFNTPKISNYKEIYKNYYRKINYKFKNYSKKKFFSYVDFSTWLVDHGLKLWDKAGMYSSIEIRVPYLDLEFLKKIFKNLENSRCKKIGFKQNLIDAYRQELPEEIINNPKKGFSVPLVMWMQNKKFKKLFINIIDNDNLILTDSYKNYLKEKILKVTNNQDAFKLWSTICLCRWLQINKLKI